MPTFLVNHKMNPALASRVSSSLRRTRNKRAAPTNPTRILLIRLSALAVVATVVFSMVREVQTRNAQLGAAKTQLQQARRQLQSMLTPRARASGERLTRLLSRESSVYPGAVRDALLAKPADLDALLNRPTVYARVEVDKVAQPERLEAALAESRKDAFVTCLKHPPEGRGEKELMKRVTEAFSTGAQEYTSNIHRVHDTLVVLRVLDNAVDRQIEQAEELPLVASLQQTWDQARLDERLPAVFGEVLIAVLDEPKAPDTPVELDGASVHGARVVIADISREQDQVLLRTRFDLDPNWVTERRRHQYAQGLEGCRMAYDVRRALEAPR